MLDAPQSQSFHFSTRVGPQWNNIELLRTAVLHGAQAVFGQGDVSEVVGMITSELMENAVRYSPPDAVVTVRARYDTRDRQGYLLTVEDWGIGMAQAELAAANELLADPPEIDLSVSKHLGFHVVARLAQRHDSRWS